MELQIRDTLFQRIEQATRLAGISTAEFIQQLLEQQEIEAYLRQPVMPGEFDVWENEQAWGEP